VRIAVGLENPADIIADLRRGLEEVKKEEIEREKNEEKFGEEKSVVVENENLEEKKEKEGEEDEDEDELLREKVARMEKELEDLKKKVNKDSKKQTRKSTDPNSSPSKVTYVLNNSTQKYDRKDYE
jgi:hypothetical protein